ncbi:NAD(P)/FAD-dependent oxidoreductase [Nocardioides sp. NPDC057577]|uniref:NAD(P)/FAD-dependent oxidoreductase n=1 Tax=Nocardioides sp. NPDC057577 TaxID=3346171 RepID=UPI00366C2485
MSASTERVVVVGHGIAGLTSADALREAGFDGDLIIIGDEPAYSRPALSKALLADAADQASTAHELPPSDHGAEEILGTRASGLDQARKVVVLSDGNEVAYDKVVIATGSRAQRLGGPEEMTLRSLADAQALRERVITAPSIVVVGGGPLGMEIASGALARGCRVSVVSQGPPLAAQLGAHLSRVFTTAARERGANVVETAGASIVGRGRVMCAEGTEVSADLVLTAVGDVPNTEWLAGSGILPSGRGPVHVDERCLVTPDVAAVGDLAAVPVFGGHRRTPLWNSAIEQAKVAATALLHGQDAPVLEPRPYFWTEAFGLSLKAVGPMPASGRPEYVDGGPGGPALMRWRHADGPATVVALDYRIPIPRMRRLAVAAG